MDWKGIVMSGKELEKFGAYQYAGFWARTGASLIDTVILLCVSTPLLFLVYGDEAQHSDSWLMGGDFIISYVMPLIATILFWIYKSATPGKMVIKAMVLDSKTGAKLSTKQAIIRYLAYFISAIPFGLGFFWVAWDGKKQGWHDKIAGTVVIRPKH